MIITCEHAGNIIPIEYQYLFNGQEEMLTSHRGWDPGALTLATYLSKKLNRPLFKTMVTRLLVEPNRSLHSHQLFSSISEKLPLSVKEKILQTHYYPYREAVEKTIQSSEMSVLHLSVHTFTPLLDGQIRELEIGLLFDPDRVEEKQFCEKMADQLSGMLPDFRIKFNEPYKGTDDGMTTYLRKKFPGSKYQGIEIEVNQKLVPLPAFNKVKVSLVESLRLLKVV